MIFRKMLNEKTKMEMKHNLKKRQKSVFDLLSNEQKRIEFAFWGINYTDSMKIFQKSFVKKLLTFRLYSPTIHNKG